MLRNILASSRYMIIIAVIGAFFSSLILLIYDALRVVNIVSEILTHDMFTEAGQKYISVEFIEIIDVFLLGTVLYIVALGLYELFIDDTLPTPRWLAIHDLEDLKAKLLGVIVVLLAVSFLGSVVNWDGKITIVALGASVGLVLLALGYLLSSGLKPHSAPPSRPGAKAMETEDTSRDA